MVLKERKFFSVEKIQLDITSYLIFLHAIVSSVVIIIEYIYIDPITNTIIGTIRCLTISIANRWIHHFGIEIRQ